MKEKNTFKERLKELDPQEQHNLINLKKKLKKSEISPRIVGEILPEAVMIGEEHHNNLSKSMIEVTERAIDYSINQDPEKLSTTLFPIIGSAIKKAVSQVMADMMANLNSGMEKAFSIKRFAWRFESFKTGIPFMEIVLRNTLQYRVDHVFLIHSKTGILLHSISTDSQSTADDDVVASMLTAVKEYIKDSLALDKSETVNSISTGEYSIFIEDGPKAILALVIRGNPDNRIRDIMLETLENIHLKLSSKLSFFSGDTDPFIQKESLLHPCLISRNKETRKKKPVYAIILLILIFGAITYFGVSSFIARSRNHNFIEALNSEPGILVASSQRRSRKQIVRLLRDSRAASIEYIASRYPVDIDNYIFEVEEFISPLFEPWEMAVRTMPEELLALSRRLGGYVLLFEQNSGDLRAGQETVFQEVLALISSIVEIATDSGYTATIEVTGHSAGNIQDEDSITISQDRAEKVMELFKSNNTSILEYITPRGIGINKPVVPDEETEEDRIQNRSVTFEVVFE